MRGEKIARKLCEFLNKKHLIALREGEGPSVCTWETSVSRSNLCGTAVIDLVSPAIRGHVCWSGLPQGISTSGQKVFPSEPVHAKSHLQQRTGAIREHRERGDGEAPATRAGHKPVCNQGLSWPQLQERTLGYTTGSQLH